MNRKAAGRFPFLYMRIDFLVDELAYRAAQFFMFLGKLHDTLLLCVLFDLTDVESDSSAAVGACLQANITKRSSEPDSLAAARRPDKLSQWPKSTGFFVFRCQLSTINCQLFLKSCHAKGVAIELAVFRLAADIQNIGQHPAGIAWVNDAVVP